MDFPLEQTNTFPPKWKIKIHTNALGNLPVPQLKLWHHNYTNTNFTGHQGQHS